EGFLLFAFDRPTTDRILIDNPPQEKMYKAFTDQLMFNRVIRVKNVGELNRAVNERRTSDLINVAEAMHDKLLGRISDDIAARRKEGGAHIVMLAGPSSSGKTTTCKRLAIQLMTNLIVPKMISLDDYFVDREHTPRDADGDYDYESLHALDLERLNSDLSRLLAGEEINLPTYSFEFGKRIEKEKPLRLDKNDVLIIEGIHGLNPELTSGINPDEIYKVYVSALTTLKIDDHNWISTSDNRLLRRIVRDYKYRHTSALDTIRRWPSVRRGEEKWIFPFSENADATFNSSLIFELGVMKEYAEPVLRSVPRDDVAYAEAFRLLRLLSYFESIPADQIPTTSLLREFLGGSSFHY
ncbi:MAG: nucleoside kinase, partial [Muribaculaceae bacterium]|nr:nucleoside kinase [Muribaculaceae bacterium]